MKKIILYFLLLFILPVSLKAQFTVGNTGDFATFGDAFDAINNSGFDLGDIVLEVIDNTNETGTAIIRPSGWDGLSLYSSITIYPTVSGLSVNGNVNGPLFDFSGVTNITIDGRVNQVGAEDLLITNTNTGASAVTFRFIESANANKIQYCIIKGSGTSATRGIIFFSTAATGNGNDGNLIDYNQITSDAAGRAVNAIYSSGTAGRENSGNIISNNKIYNFLRQATSSAGVNLSSNSTGFTISGNSFYETTNFAPSANVAYYAVQVNNSSGTGFNIEGNFIGGKAELCGGAAWTKTVGGAPYYNNPFYGISLNAGTSVASNIQGNTIKNFNWTNFGSAAWSGIHIQEGTVNIGNISGNSVGDESVPASVTVNGGAINTPVFGINISSAGTINCQFNKIANLYNSSTTGGSSVTGLNFSGSTGSNTVNGNYIYNLSVSGASANSSVYGIKVVSGASTYSNNVISLGGNTETTIYGMFETGAAGNNNNLYFNTFYISGSPTSGTPNSYALYSAVTTNTRNFRNNIFFNARSNSGASGSHYAIYIAASGGTLTINYNDYFTSGTGGILGYLVSDIPTLAAWKAATTQDANSLSIDPVFTSTGGPSLADYQATATLPAVTGTSILTDITGAVRSATAPTMGAFEAGPCTNPTSGGTIAADQNGCSPFDPNVLNSTGLPSGYLGILEYKWQKSTTSSSSGFSDIATSNSIFYDPASLTQTTWYKRVARVTCKSDWVGAAESNVLEVTVKPLPTATITGTLNACASTTLTAVTNAASPSYVWYQDYAVIPGETSSTLFVAVDGPYRVMVTDAASACKQTSTASNVTLKPLPSALITGTLTACVTTTLSATTNASSPAYNWFKDNVLINGETASTLDVTASGAYKVKVTDGTTLCEQTSAPSSVTIHPLPTVIITGTLTACATTTLTAVSDAVSPSYVWYKDDLVIGGQTASSLIVTESGDYKVKVTNGTTTCEQTSAPSTVTINPFPTVSISGALSACGSTLLTAETNVTSGSYIWYKDNVEITGETQSTLLVTSGGDYKVNVTDGTTTCDKTSDPSTVTIIPLPSVSITGTLTACATTTLTAVSDAVSPAYEWYRDDVVISGETSATLEATSSGDYKVKVTDGVTTCDQTSAASTVQINPLPLAGLTVNGTGTVCTGSGTNITVDLSESGISYQLRNSAGNFDVGSPVPGTGGTIELPTGNLSTQTVFNVLATNPATGCFAELSETEEISIDATTAAGSVSGTSGTITYGESTGDLTLSGNNGNILKWQKVKDAGSWEDIVNLNPVYSESPSAAGDWQYRAEVRNGECPADFSAAFSISVLQKALTVTADDQEKVYGTDFTFSGTEFSSVGLINNDQVTGVTLSSSGSAASSTVTGSPYPIIPENAAGTGLENYSVAYSNGLLTVSKAVLTVTADDREKVYGTANPVLTFTYSGFQNGENESVLLSAPEISTIVTELTSAGNYPGAITLSGGSADNYDFLFVSADFNITQAEQTITITDAPAKLLAGTSATITATSSSGLPVLFESLDNQVASVSGDQVTGVSRGTVQIRAYNDGDQNYMAAEAFTGLTVTATHKEILHLFTPNNDGFNDQWELTQLAEWGRCDVKVYNRWGKLVFSDPDYDNLWDGTSDGTQLPEGPYFFVIDTENAGLVKGTVNIVR